MKEYWDYLFGRPLDPSRLDIKVGENVRRYEMEEGGSRFWSGETFIPLASFCCP